MNRRSFMAALGALVAVAAVPKRLLALVRPETDDERFARHLATGRVADQSFVLRAPHLATSDLVVERCHIVMDNDARIVCRGTHAFEFSNNTFDLTRRTWRGQGSIYFTKTFDSLPPQTIQWSGTEDPNRW